MSMTTYRESAHSRLSQSIVTTYLELAFSVVLKLRDAWRRRQNEHVLESLPADIRKDIGWPSADSHPDRR